MKEEERVDVEGQELHDELGEVLVKSEDEWSGLSSAMLSDNI
jgi:hypothetical protein